MQVSLDINEKHAKALLKLIDLLDYEIIRSCAGSEQEAYDVVLALTSLRMAVMAADPTAG